MTCSSTDCTSIPVARGLCNNHYQQAKYKGILDEVAPKVHPPCARCGGEIPQARRFGATFCSVSCKDAEMEDRKREAASQRRGSRRVDCAWCSTPIEQTRSDQRFCSRSCADAWRNDLTRLHTLRAKRDLDRKCEVCAEQIPAARPTQAIYCSPECKLLGSRAHTPRKRKSLTAYNRQRLYGITQDQFDTMLAAQGGRCAICKTDEWRGKDNSPHVDHDHTTGRIRGILCTHCKNGLGNFRDDPARLRAAIRYLA